MFQGRVVALRPVEDADLAMLANLANDARVRNLVVGWDTAVSIGSQSRWRSEIATGSDPGRLVVAERETGRPIGITGLWEIDWHNRDAVSAIKLDPDLAPPGAGSDAIMLVNAWAFYEVGLHRLHSGILAFNTRSLAAYVRKSAWRIEGVDAESIFRNGAWHDLIRVAILREDFDAHPAAAEYVGYISPGLPSARGENGDG